ncbi:ComF family protein [Acuticoccus mangrovi]|uniref:ComF family protein n=1 Tax=Acuticoccus mangrovi TaxID=2796142 RepID=A0A934IKP1_9HYPH|nr:ComF family protein [Acuticoccus mangrovi]MBJ3774083.1 ComF family protein [Acuticoccus mangrovi]
MSQTDPHPTSRPPARPDAPLAWGVILAARAELAQMGRHALDAVVPPVCAVCRRPLSEPRSLCGECWRGLEIITPPICDITGTPLAFDAGPGARSPELRWNHPLYDRARAAVVFGPTSQRLIHELKYHDVPGIADLMARLMAPAIRDLAGEADVMIPVPLHRRRLAVRRFNQSVMIADRLAPLVGLPVDRRAVRRVRHTRHQVGLSRDQRANNLAKAFKVADPGAVKGRRILLVDDVLTTGATVDSLAVTLQAAGAQSVNVAVFARVVGENREPQ